MKDMDVRIKNKIYDYIVKAKILVEKLKVGDEVWTSNITPVYGWKFKIVCMENGYQLHCKCGQNILNVVDSYELPTIHAVMDEMYDTAMTHPRNFCA